MKKRMLQLCEDVEFEQNVTEEKKPVLSGGAPLRRILQNKCFRDFCVIKNY